MRWLLKRWWFWAGTGFMLVAVCAGYLLIPVEKARITQENYDKIQEGWSEKQVEDLLGSCTLHGNVIARSGRTPSHGGNQSGLVYQDMVRR
jgi:hypothetical protein